MAKAIAIVSGGYAAKEEIKFHGGMWVTSAKMWVMTVAGFEKMKSRSKTWGGSYSARQAAEGKVVDYKNGVVSEWIEPVTTTSTPANAQVSTSTPTPTPEPAAAIEIKSSEVRNINYTFARIKREDAMAIAQKIGMEKAKELFAKTKGVEYNQRTGDYSYYFNGTSARQVGDILSIKFKNPNELELAFAEYIKSNPSSVNGFSPAKSQPAGFFLTV